jgi:hypothetical protein
VVDFVRADVYFSTATGEFEIVFTADASRPFPAGEQQFPCWSHDTFSFTGCFRGADWNGDGTIDLEDVEGIYRSMFCAGG